MRAADGRCGYEITGAAHAAPVTNKLLPFAPLYYRKGIFLYRNAFTRCVAQDCNNKKMATHLCG